MEGGAVVGVVWVLQHKQKHRICLNLLFLFSNIFFGATLIHVCIRAHDVNKNLTCIVKLVCPPLPDSSCSVCLLVEGPNPDLILPVGG